MRFSVENCKLNICVLSFKNADSTVVSPVFDFFINSHIPAKSPKFFYYGIKIPFQIKSAHRVAKVKSPNLQRIVVNRKNA